MRKYIAEFIGTNCIAQLVIREIVLTKRVCMLSMSFSRR
jgi:hypothetical protein